MGEPVKLNEGQMGGQAPKTPRIVRDELVRSRIDDLDAMLLAHSKEKLLFLNGKAEAAGG